MATSAYEEAAAEMNNGVALERGKAQEASTVLEFIRENIGIWKGGAASGVNSGEKGDAAVGMGGGADHKHKKNMFSQQDSEAQFINQDDDDEDEEGEYGEEGHAEY